MTEEEIAENETLWKEENGLSSSPTEAGAQLRGVGITPSNISADMDLETAEVPVTPETDTAGATDAGTGATPESGTETT